MRKVGQRQPPRETRMASTMVTPLVCQHQKQFILGLFDEDDVVMSNSPSQPKIEPEKKKEMVAICQSGFGQKFVKPLAYIDLTGTRVDQIISHSVSQILEKLEKDEYADLEEAVGDAINMLDQSIKSYQYCFESKDYFVNSFGNHSKDELICMVDYLKDKFNELLEATTSGSTMQEEDIFRKLLEVFPNKDPCVLVNKVKEYLDNTNTIEDITFIVQEIAGEIINDDMIKDSSFPGSQ